MCDESFSNSGVDMTSLYWPEFCRVGLRALQGSPRGEELQTLVEGVRPGVKTGFDDGVEKDAC